MKERLLAALGPLLGVALFGLALAILHHELAGYHYHDVVQHLSAIPRRSVALSLGLTAAGYLSLTGYDALALIDRVLTDPAGEAPLTALEDRLRGTSVDW